MQDVLGRGRPGRLRRRRVGRCRRRGGLLRDRRSGGPDGPGRAVGEEGGCCKKTQSRQNGKHGRELYLFAGYAGFAKDSRCNRPTNTPQRSIPLAGQLARAALAAWQGVEFDAGANRARCGTRHCRTARAIASMSVKGGNPMRIFGVSWLFVVVMVIAGCSAPIRNQGHMPPAQMMMHPGPGVDGPGPGVHGLSAAGSFGGPASQLAFRSPEGMEVRWDVTAPGRFDSEPLVLPARYSFPQGAIYRLKLSNIPGRAGRGTVSDGGSGRGRAADRGLPGPQCHSGPVHRRRFRPGAQRQFRHQGDLPAQSRVPGAGPGRRRGHWSARGWSRAAIRSSRRPVAGRSWRSSAWATRTCNCPRPAQVATAMA